MIVTIQYISGHDHHASSYVAIHETEIKPPGSKWSGPGPPEGRNRVEIGSK